MTQQDTMIGKHPKEGIYYEWTKCFDTECSLTKRHRQLIAKEEARQSAIDKISDWLVKYHLSDGKRKQLLRKKEILEKYEFSEYAKELHIFPNVDKTKKGNLGEIILTEYLSQTLGIRVLVYKLRYNPNVDQSMKGDDVLLVDSKRIIVGESKFRSVANKQAVEDTTKVMNAKLVLPLSLGFVADRLFEQGLLDLAEEIQDLQLNLGKTNHDIKNVALLLSTPNVGKFVECNMSSSNSDFIFLSLGIENPTEFVEEVFRKATERLLEVHKDEA